MEFSNNILHRRGFVSNDLSTPLQSQVDGLVGGFAVQATDWRSLAAMMAGGMAYRMGRVGAMGLNAGPGVRALTIGVGLSAEVSTFELSHRGLSTFAANSTHLSPNLWRWEGSGGIRQGLLQSFITFGAIKSAGRLAQGQNVIAQHLLQDTAMVFGHQASAALGIAPHPSGTLAEQFLHAEATNLQIGAGMALAHRFAPGAHALERGLDLTVRSNDVEAGFPRPRWLSNGTGAERAPLPALATTGSHDSLPMGDKGPAPLILAMSSTKGDGGGRGRRDSPPVVESRRITRGEPTLPVVTVWDPYRIEGMPKDAVTTRLEGTPENLAERLQAEISRHLDQGQNRSILIGLEVEKARDLDEGALGRDLLEFFRRRQASSPIAEGLKIAVAIPAKNTAFLLEVEGGALRLKRSLFDARGSLVIDDTPDEGAEASAAKARESLPPGTAVASTILQVFEAFKAGIERGEKEMTVQYEGSLWSAASTESFTKWFKTGRTQLSPDQTAILLLPRQGSRLEFSRKGKEVQCAEVGFEPRIPTPPPPSRPTPMPASAPGSDRRRRTTPGSVDAEAGSRGARKTPGSRPASVPPIFGGIALDLATLRSKIGALKLEAPGAEGEVLYAGEERVVSDEIERSLQGPAGLKEGQRILLYLSRFQVMIEFVRPEGKPIAVREEKTDREISPFSAVSASSYGELFQKASFLLSRDPRESRHSQIFYRGKDWSTERALEDLRLFLSVQPLREGQSLKIQAGRGGGEISIERKADLVQVEVQGGEGSAQNQVWTPEAASGRWRRMEPLLGKAYSYLSLDDYHALAVRLVKAGLGNRQIGDIIEQRVHTGLPVETLAQAPAYRGRFLAVIAAESLKNRELPRYLQQWVEVHRFIERAYVHFDPETVQAFRRNVNVGEYDKGVRAYNESVPPEERLIPLEEMPTDLPGIPFLPKEFSLRDAFARQVMEKGRSVAQNLLLLHDPEGVGRIFAAVINNRMAILFSSVDYLSRKHPGGPWDALLTQDIRRLEGDLLDARNTVVDLFAEFREYGRILNEGKGPIQREFLRGAFASPAGMRESYLRLLQWMNSIPVQLRARHFLPTLPALEHLESRSSNPPAIR